MKFCKVFDKKYQYLNRSYRLYKYKLYCVKCKGFEVQHEIQQK